MVMKNWRTTLMGAGAIISALGDIMAQVGAWHLDPDHLLIDITGLLTGFGLLFASDAAEVKNVANPTDVPGGTGSNGPH